MPGAGRPNGDAADRRGVPLNTTNGTPAGELERVCRENELVIEAWSPIHLRSRLREWYWKPDKPAAQAQAFWGDSLRYLYLPRLRSRDVLAAAVREGALSRDFFGTAYGQSGGKYEGFQFGGGDVTFDDSLLLIDPEVARQYAAEQSQAIGPTDETPASVGPTVGTAATVAGGKKATGTGTATPKARSFCGTVEVNATLAKSRLNTIADEVIALLASDPSATVRSTLEVDAEFPNGASDTVKRAVSENAASLGFKAKDWE
jgi:hypothetical protein